MLPWKLRITVLWISLAVCQSASLALVLLEPGAVRDLMAGELLGVDLHDAGVQVTTALFWIGPMVMAYLTLVLKDAANRSANGLLGAGAVLNGIANLTGQPGATSVGAQLIGVVVILVALLIVWHVWKWPRTSEVTPPPQTHETKQR